MTYTIIINYAKLFWKILNLSISYDEPESLCGFCSFLKCYMNHLIRIKKFFLALELQEVTLQNANSLHFISSAAESLL